MHIQLLCSVSVTVIGGVVMGKTDTGKANTAVIVLGAIASALTTLSKSCEYDGKPACNAEAAKFYTQGQNTAAGFLRSHVLQPRLPDILVDNCTTLEQFVQPQEEPGSGYQAMRLSQAHRCTCVVPHGSTQYGFLHTCEQ